MNTLTNYLCPLWILIFNFFDIIYFITVDYVLLSLFFFFGEFLIFMESCDDDTEDYGVIFDFDIGDTILK